MLSWDVKESRGACSGRSSSIATRRRPGDPRPIGNHPIARSPVHPIADSPPDTVFTTPFSAEERITAFLRSVYGWMCAGLAITAAVAFFVASSPTLAETLIRTPFVMMGLVIAQLGLEDKICAFGFDLGPKMLDQIKSGALDGSLGQQPFLQGFYPIVQLYLQIDRGVAAADLDTKAQLVTKDNVEAVGKRFEN